MKLTSLYEKELKIRDFSYVKGIIVQTKFPAMNQGPQLYQGRFQNLIYLKKVSRVHQRFCQDPLENYFGRQRSLGRRQDNPNLRTFGYQDNTIRTSKMFKPIQSGNSRETPEPFSISSEHVPCRSESSITVTKTKQ